MLFQESNFEFVSNLDFSNATVRSPNLRGEIQSWILSYSIELQRLKYYFEVQI